MKLKNLLYTTVSFAALALGTVSCSDYLASLMLAWEWMKFGTTQTIPAIGME